MLLDGVDDDLTQLLDEVVLGVVEIGLVVHLPPAAGADLAALHDEDVSGWELIDSGKQRLVRERELKRQVVAETVEVRLDARQERKEDLRLGRAVENVVDERRVERLDAEPVPGDDEALGTLVPERECEHAAESGKRVQPPPPVGTQDDLRIRVRPEGPLAELAAELLVVEDLAVEGDPVSLAVAQRLIPVLEIDDLEPRVGEADVPARVRPQSLAVGAAVGEQLDHALEGCRQMRDTLVLERGHSPNAAHFPMLVGCSRAATGRKSLPR